MKIVNFTPHDVVLMNQDEEEIRIFIPAGYIVSVMFEYLESTLNGIPVVKADKQNATIVAKSTSSGRKWLDFEEQFPPKDGIYYIVSSFVRSCMPKRQDLLSPSTRRGDQVRTSKGLMRGIKAFESN